MLNVKMRPLSLELEKSFFVRFSNSPKRLAPAFAKRLKKDDIFGHFSEKKN